MESPTRQELREARTVEIAFSVIVGVVVFGVLSVGVLLTGWLGGLSGPTWANARDVAMVVAVALGVSTAVWLLVRAHHSVGTFASMCAGASVTRPCRSR